MSRQPKCLVTLRLHDRSVGHLSFSEDGCMNVRSRVHRPFSSAVVRTEPLAEKDLGDPMMSAQC